MRPSKNPVLESSLYIMSCQAYPTGTAGVCPLCQTRGFQEYILNCSSKAVGEGRYMWCQQAKHQFPARHSITFVHAGERPPDQQRISTGLLASRQDWKLQVNLVRQLKSPEYIAITMLRADIVLSSISSKQVVKLTVPWQDQIEEAHEQKKAKYQELVETYRGNGWKASCKAIEVSCRGFPEQSLNYSLKLLGIRGLQESIATKESGRENF